MKKREISLGKSFIPVIALLLIMYIIIFKLESEVQIALILSTVIATIVAMSEGFTWYELQIGIESALRDALGSMMILLIVGMIISTWTISGIVPTIIYYGLKFIKPSIFLPAAALLSAIVALATGSSWSTAGTIGIALMGVGKGMDIPAPIVAGAVISGAYFGDKMSPLSDSTNMAPAVAGTDIFTHIRHMLYTTIPALVISLILYFFIGMKHAEIAYVGQYFDEMVDELSKRGLSVFEFKY